MLSHNNIDLTQTSSRDDDVMAGTARGCGHVRGRQHKLAESSPSMASSTPPMEKSRNSSVRRPLGHTDYVHPKKLLEELQFWGSSLATV